MYALFYNSRSHIYLRIRIKATTDVTTSANGTASHSPLSPSHNGNSKKAGTSRTMPRSNISSVEKPACSVLW